MARWLRVTGLVALAASVAGQHFRGAVSRKLGATGPSGSYAGSANVFGQHIHAGVTAVDEGLMDLVLAGRMAVDCEGEAFAYDAGSGAVSMVHAGDAGNCVHDALAEAGVRIESIVYDAAADRIDVEVAHGWFEFTLELMPTDSLDNVRRHRGLGGPAAAAQEERGLGEVGATLTGTYAGSTVIGGKTITATTTFVSSSALDFTVGGPITVTCKDEPYSYDGGSTITLVDAGTKGDCVHDALAASNASISNIKYDTGKDTITVVVDLGLLSLTIVLQHTSAVEA